MGQYQSKYPEIVIDNNPNSGVSSMTFPITIEQFYDLMHHTHKVSDIIMEGGGGSIEEGVINEINNNINDLKQETQEQSQTIVQLNQTIIQQNETIILLTEQLQELQEKVNNGITIPDDDSGDITTP